jgi:hypothetical protein
VEEGETSITLAQEADGQQKNGRNMRAGVQEPLQSGHIFK